MSEKLKKHFAGVYEYVTGYFGTLFLFGTGALTLVTFITFLAMLLEV